MPSLLYGTLIHRSILKSRSDVNYIAKMGVFMTPGLVVDDKVASVGKVLSVEEIKQKIEENLP